MPKRSLYKKVAPDEVKTGMNFSHLGLLWEVYRVKDEGLSKAFYARVWMCPAGFTDCTIKLDVHISNQIHWINSPE